MTLLGRPLRWPVVAVAAASVVVAVLVYAVRSDGSGRGYRLAPATTGVVEQVISVGGTVDAARRADLSFATDGTVVKVAVTQGERVKAGQVVARLDTTSLRATVIDAEATLAKAKAQLASDRSAQAQAVTTATQPASSPADTKPSSGSGKPSSDGQGAGNTAVLATLKRQQAAVLSAQSAASKAIAAAKQALQAQTRACADATAAATAGSGAAVTADSEADGESATAEAGDAMDACTAALDEVRDRQDDVASAQETLAGGLDALAAILTKALGTVAASQETSGSPGQSPGTTKSDAAAGAAASTASQSNRASRTVTAATLASDQASIDQAEADLVEAEQALSRATLRATRSGRVAAVDVAKGDSVSAGDTVAVVVGGKAVTVTASVDESQIGEIEAGQAARVSTPGNDASATGTVTAVGMVGDSSSGITTYPVTVLVEDPEILLPTGSRAMLAITIGMAQDVVTVPVSAVTRDGASAVVRIEKDGAASSRRVALGVVGATSVAVTEGLSAGDQVILADIDQTITGASTTLDNRPGFGGPGAVSFSGGGALPSLQRGRR